MDILEILGKVGFDWRMGLVNLVNFFIIFFLVSKFLIKPISKKLNERYEKISEGLKNAEESKLRLENAEKEYEKRIDEAKIEVAKMIEEANIRGEKVLNDYEEKAKKDITRMMNDAEIKISKQKDKMIKELEESYTDNVFSVVEKILQNKIDKKEQEKIINNTLK